MGRTGRRHNQNKIDQQIDFYIETINKQEQLEEGDHFSADHGEHEQYKENQRRNR